MRWVSRSSSRRLPLGRLGFLLERKTSTVWGLLVHLGGVGPAEPGDRAVQAGEVEARRATVSVSGWAPFAVLQHPGLVALADQRAAMGADVLRLPRPALRPAQILEFQRLVLAAVRAGHDVPALVARLVLPLDPREALRLRRRDQQDLAPLEGRRPALRRAGSDRPRPRRRRGSRPPRRGTDTAPAWSAGPRRCWRRSGSARRPGTPC